MEPRIRIFLLAVSSASLIGCAHQAEPTVNSQSESGKGIFASNIGQTDKLGIGIREMRSARGQLEWRRARQEKRPAAPLY